MLLELSDRTMILIETIEYLYPYMGANDKHRGGLTIGLVSGVRLDVVAKDSPKVLAAFKAMHAPSNNVPE